jgi:hypothetical protein
MSAERRFPLASGRTCVLRPKPLLGLPTYHVLFLAADRELPSADEEREMFALAQVAATSLAVRFCGDPGCYAILFSGGSTRRRPWPHFHIVAVRDLAAKRRALALLYVKGFLIRLQSLTSRWPVRKRRP